jgi:hypothetical protein
VTSRFPAVTGRIMNGRSDWLASFDFDDLGFVLFLAPLFRDFAFEMAVSIARRVG